MEIELGILKNKLLNLNGLIGPETLKEVEEWCDANIGAGFNDFVQDASISISCLFKLMALACYYEDKEGFKLFYSRLERNIQEYIAILDKNCVVSDNKN